MMQLRIQRAKICQISNIFRLNVRVMAKLNSKSISHTERIVYRAIWSQPFKLKRGTVLILWMRAFTISSFISRRPSYLNRQLKKVEATKLHCLLGLSKLI